MSVLPDEILLAAQLVTAGPAEAVPELDPGGAWGSRKWRHLNHQPGRRWLQWGQQRRRFIRRRL